MGLLNILSTIYSTLRISRVNKEQITSFQQQRFRKLLRYAAAHSEFYQTLYKGIDIANCDLRGLPIVTKFEMMDNFDRFVTDKRLKLRQIQEWSRDENNTGKYYLDKYILIYTSGSSGQPALVIYTQKAMEKVQANLFTRAALIHKKPSISHFLKMFFRLLLGTKVRSIAIVNPRGNIAAIPQFSSKGQDFFIQSKNISTFESISDIVVQLNKIQPDWLITYPSVIDLLAQEQMTGHLDLTFNHPDSYIAVGGEPLSQQTKSLVLESWNKRLINIYGSAECFTMATSCYAHNQLHTASNMSIIEVVDRDGNPVPDGQYGDKVLLTNLFNYTQPLIRYEIDDITGYGMHNCECGNHLPTTG
jgi:phenylacetate-coenzyme A ligase PaaK-like adenylate-forming protein